MDKPKDPKDITVSRNLYSSVCANGMPNGLYVKAMEVKDGIARDFFVRFNDFNDFISVVRAKGEPSVFR